MPSPKEKIRQIIYEEQTKRPGCALAIIRKTYPDEYLCDILIINNSEPNLGSYHSRVPLPMIGGVSYALPHVGDKVLVEFLGGDLNYPLVTAIYPSTQAQIKGQSEVAASAMDMLSEMR
jgi:hypothetical protein